LFWVADALVQAVHGVDLFGYVKLDPRHLNGVFGRHLHLGVYLAVFSALLLVHARRFWRPWAQLASFAATAVVVLLAGSRGGWINFGLILAAYFVFLLGENRRLALRLAAGVALVLALGAAVSYRYAPGFDARVRQSLLVFKGDKRDINQAISGRVPIWTVSLKMFATHPLTGVGACSYRYAYPKYAAPNDPFYNKKTGASHPHQILLETMSETGAIGLAGLLIFFAVLIGAWQRTGREGRRRMLPYGLALLGALFPINTGFALYSAIWGQVIFWFVSLYVASGQAIEPGGHG
jgi:O-antigen ligase